VFALDKTVVLSEAGINDDDVAVTSAAQINQLLTMTTLILAN